MIHLPTLIITTIILNIVLGITLLVIHRAIPTQKSFKTWALACFLFALANVLTSLRGTIEQPWLTIVVADLLIISVPLLALHGMRQYRQQTDVPLTSIVVTLVVSTILLLSTLSIAHVAEAMTATLCGVIYLFAANYLRHIRPTPRITRQILMGLFGIHGLLMLLMANTALQIADTSETLFTLLLMAHLMMTTMTTLLFPVLAFSHNERRLLKIAHLDELTELFNRRAFFEQGALLLAQNKQLEKPSCILMIDLDHFKSINDQFGHAAGDACLRHVAEIIRRTMRERDVAARIGGEEFAIALADVDRQQAEMISQRLVERIAAQSFHFDGRDIELTVSLGGILSVRSTRSLDDLLNDADAALYAAKASGRNQFKFA
ncbi:hypothetical protein CWI76_08700 [Pseudidiomarina marina]|uniref:diguanylate cyclase n=1 Tax=Pseudidiomarina marina TaxID=502366 RepID=A0A432YDU4_9GAMM|nr:hypothetical protein CWI76_08700 [Pseudidiomarina marina]